MPLYLYLLNGRLVFLRVKAFVVFRRSSLQAAEDVSLDLRLIHLRVLLHLYRHQRLVTVLHHMLRPGVPQLLHNQTPLLPFFLDRSHERDVFFPGPSGVHLQWIEMVHPMLAALLGVPVKFLIGAGVKLPRDGVPLLLVIFGPALADCYSMICSSKAASSCVHLGDFCACLRSDMLWY